MIISGGEDGVIRVGLCEEGSPGNLRRKTADGETGREINILRTNSVMDPI